MSFGIPRTVFILGLVSFLNDAASEMITPLLPIFLTAVLGSGPTIVGLIEGLAEATASLLKLFSGRLLDHGFRAKQLVLIGYGLSNVLRPLLGLAVGWFWVLLLRFLDRVGKGMRTSPRDALIAASVETNRRGLAFGVHRAFDNAGGCRWALARLRLAQFRDGPGERLSLVSDPRHPGHATADLRPARPCPGHRAHPAGAALALVFA